MGTVIGVPNELAAFLDRPAPQTLLLQGAPGTGKTLLCFELLQGFRGRRIYVSSRVPRPNLERDFPGVAPHPDSDEFRIIDITAARTDIREIARALGSARKLVTEGEPGPDLRALFLPPEVLEAWSQTSPKLPTLVILDSWDAIVERHVGTSGASDSSLPTREEVERIAVAQMTAGPVFVVFVAERREAGQLEYLVDGVVSMGREVHDQRTERWLHIDKLRGTRIVEPSYPFTLEGGRFRCLEPSVWHPQSKRTDIDRDSNPPPGTIWPGSTDYALHFGRLSVGKLTLIEHDPDVPIEALEVVLHPIIAEVLHHQGRVVHVPPPVLHPADMFEHYKAWVTKEEFSRQVRFLAVLPNGVPLDLDPNLLPLPRPSEMGNPARTPDVAKFLSGNLDPASPNLVVESIDGLRAINSVVPNTYTAETLPGMALTNLHASPTHMIWTGGEGDPLTQSLRWMAATRIRMRWREGRVFVYGMVPRTPSLLLSDGDGRTPYHLLLIV
jgi:KaiC/GvpD/RAD55 family RecA-like ATPase